MEPKFTPGPWEMYGRGGGVSVQHGRTKDGHIHIAWIGPATRERNKASDANIRLIAAAPDMYDLLDRVHEAINGDEDDENYIDRISILANRWNTLRAKINGEK